MFYIDEGLLNMVSRSGCSIRSLDISHCWSAEETDDISGEVLTAIPRFFSEVCQDVEDLILVTGSYKQEDIYDCIPILQKMVVGKNNTNLQNFPRLKRLQIKDLQLDPILLAHVIQSRQDHTFQKDSVVASLERVEIAYKNQFGQKNSMAEYYSDTLNAVLSNNEVHSKCEVVVDP